MGNCTSCCYIELPPIAKLIDVHGNLRFIKVPITAAEIMLEEEPGLVVSPADDLRQNSRLTALRADDKLHAGKLYMLIPAGRVHAKVSKSVMETVESAVKRRRAASATSKQCSSKVGAAAVTAAEEEEDESLVNNGLEEEDNGGGFTSYVMQAGSCRQWKPVLEPILEGH